jgi:hypothetical protein
VAETVSAIEKGATAREPGALQHARGRTPHSLGIWRQASGVRRAFLADSNQGA